MLNSKLNQRWVQKLFSYSNYLCLCFSRSLYWSSFLLSRAYSSSNYLRFCDACLVLNWVTVFWFTTWNFNFSFDFNKKGDTGVDWAFQMRIRFLHTSFNVVYLCVFFNNCDVWSLVAAWIGVGLWTRCAIKIIVSFFPQKRQLPVKRDSLYTASLSNYTIFYVTVLNLM